MTNCMLPSVDRSGKWYDSAVWHDASSVAGVRFAVARMSFGRRLELMRKIREIGRKTEFLTASADVKDQFENAVLTGDVERAYLEWGLVAVEGLTIDGEAAAPNSLIEKGPVELTLEILSKVKSECGLSEDEQKN
jgi:hypothetical protein